MVYMLQSMDTELSYPIAYLIRFSRGGIPFGSSRLHLAQKYSSSVPSRVLSQQVTILLEDPSTVHPGAFSVRLHLKIHIIYFCFALPYTPFGPTFAINWALLRIGQGTIYRAPGRLGRAVTWAQNC